MNWFCGLRKESEIFHIKRLKFIQYLSQKKYPILLDCVDFHFDLDCFGPNI